MRVHYEIVLLGEVFVENECVVLNSLVSILVEVGEEGKEIHGGWEKKKKKRSVMQMCGLKSSCTKNYFSLLFKILLFVKQSL